LILEAQFNLAPDNSMSAAALATVAAAERLYGKGVANQVISAFQDRGILRSASLNPEWIGQVLLLPAPCLKIDFDERSAGAPADCFYQSAWSPDQGKNTPPVQPKPTQVPDVPGDVFV
jgi:hypothetical protein